MLSSDRRKIERGWIVAPFIDGATAPTSGIEMFVNQREPTAMHATGATGSVG